MKRLGSLACAAAMLCAGRGAADTADKGTVVKLEPLQSRAPAGWVQQKTTNRFRVYQFRIPKADGDPRDGELVIFHFGEGQGGNARDNIKRWQSAFEPPAGKRTEDISKVEKLTVGDVPATYLDIHGTLLDRFPPFDPNAKVTRRPHYRRLAVVFESPGGPYFIRLTGPANTVARNKKAFDDWLKAFK